ncbi:hypothetical protein EDD22DRAFT_842428 [Suillus occidentalis]|nr:hypothetical protein EDD22DRAFT_842428 [Suillus occidentalis]
MTSSSMMFRDTHNSSDGLGRKMLSGGVAPNPAPRLGAGHEPVHAAHTDHGILISSLSGDALASPSAFFGCRRACCVRKLVPPIETLWSTPRAKTEACERTQFGRRFAFAPDKARWEGRGDSRMGGLEKSICVLGPRCPYKVRWQRGIYFFKCLGGVVVVHLRGIKVLHSGIVMFLDPNFILDLTLVIPLLHCQFRGIKSRSTYIRLSPT